MNCHRQRMRIIWIRGWNSLGLVMTLVLNNQNSTAVLLPLFAADPAY